MSIGLSGRFGTLGATVASKGGGGGGGGGAPIGSASNPANNAREIRDSGQSTDCLLYTSPSPRDATLSRMPSSA